MQKDVYKRQHLETFHVLTDGTGAMQFLKAVCYRYCQLAHPEMCIRDRRTISSTS